MAGSWSRCLEASSRNYVSHFVHGISCDDLFVGYRETPDGETDSVTGIEEETMKERGTECNQ